MNNQDEQLEVRKMAVEHHHAEAKRFVGWYEEMEKVALPTHSPTDATRLMCFWMKRSRNYRLAHTFWMSVVEPENMSVVRTNLGSLPVDWSLRTPCVQPRSAKIRARRLFPAWRLSFPLRTRALILSFASKFCDILIAPIFGKHCARSTAYSGRVARCF